MVISYTFGIRNKKLLEYFNVIDESFNLVMKQEPKFCQNEYFGAIADPKIRLLYLAYVFRR